MIKKKRNKKSNTSDKSILPYAQAKGNPIESYFRDIFTNLRNSFVAGVEEPFRSMDFNDIRWMASRIPIFHAIINKRSDEIIQFCKPQRKKNDKGFIVEMVNEEDSPSDIDKKNIEYLENFILRTGAFPDSKREDTLPKFMRAMLREQFTIDQCATEIQYNKRKEVIAFHRIDGATIRRTTEFLRKENSNTVNESLSFNQHFERDDIQFVQVINNVIKAEYTSKEIVFDYLNPRNDVRFYGYGYSYFEQAIDIAIMLTYSLEYNKGFFRFDKLPRGVLAVQGLTEETARKIQAYVQAMMSGPAGKWKVPILPLFESGKDIQWINFNQSNRDMEFYKFISYLTAIFAAICSVDLAELGLRLQETQAVVSNEAVDDKLRHSKDTGLGALLTFWQNYINQIIWKITNRYNFRFVGYDIESEKEALAIKKMEIETFRSINDLRKEKDEKPFEFKIGDVNIYDIPAIANQQVFQLINSKLQNEMMSQGQGGQEEAPEGEAPEEEEPISDEDLEFEPI